MENQTKVQDFCLHFEKIRHPWRAHNAMHVTIDWTCQIISSQILGCGLVSIDRYAWYCVRHGFRIFSKCKQNCCTFVWFSSRSNPNTQPISVCDISKERKQISAQIYNLLFLSRDYTLRVIIEWIYCIVTFFAHCITLFLGLQYVLWICYFTLLNSLLSEVMQTSWKIFKYVLFSVSVSVIFPFNR